MNEEKKPDNPEGGIKIKTEEIPCRKCGKTVTKTIWIFRGTTLWSIKCSNCGYTNESGTEITPSRGN